MHRKPAAWGRGGSRGGRGRQFGLQPIGLNRAVDRSRDSQPVSYAFWGILMDFREFPWAHKNPLRCMKIRPGCARADFRASEWILMDFHGSIKIHKDPKGLPKMHRKHRA